MLTTLYRMEDGQRRVIHGHLSKYEVAAMRGEGWREDNPQVNKNGFSVQFKRERTG